MRLALGLVTALVLTCATVAQAEKKISFKKTTLDKVFRAEGVAVGDYNKDGKLDIAASDVYFAAPDWKPVTLYSDEKTGKAREYDPLRYSNCFQSWSDDLNGDGWTDLIVVDFPGSYTWWLENPKTADRPWKRHMLMRVTNNESVVYADIDGDGKRELIAGTSPDAAQSDGPDRTMVIARRSSEPESPWTLQHISEKAAASTTRFSHGLGIGDINRDGRADVIVTQGWWESPADKAQSPWTFRAAKLGQPAAYMFAYDFDGDGDQDVISSAAHQLGMWWHEQTPDGFVQHEISKSFSQTHALWLGDLNGDGLADFITGKRYWAHGPKGDVDPGAPAVLCWFELTRKNGKPEWIEHAIDDDSGVGTQFEVTDVNGDGLLDVAIANKKGVFYFEQRRE